jgi:hypothetical protein
MRSHARGTFEVKMSPQPPYDSAGGISLGRVSLQKQFTGDLTATTSAEMLSAVTGVKGSAGYVAIERVTGTLHGRAGSFVLQHMGTMNRGKPALTVAVVPDSGTDDLTGIAGEMTIEIVDGKHLYGFDYVLDPTPSGEGA